MSLEDDRLLMSDLHDPVNIGNPNEISIRDVAQEVVDIIGSSSKVVFQDLPVDDPKVRRPDITRALKELGWKAVVPRREGLKKVIDYFRGKVLGEVKDR